jgi:hypothetical protein
MQEYADIYLLQSHSSDLSDFALNKYLHTVASSWIFINIKLNSWVVEQASLFSVAFQVGCLVSVHLRLGVMFISCMVEFARKVIEPLTVFV